MPVSPATVRRARRGLLAALATGTTVFAVVLIVHALTPGRVALTPTSQLVVILALLLLPAATIAAWGWDRSLRQRFAAVRTDPPDDPPVDPDEPDVTLRDYPKPREHPAGRVRPHASPATAGRTPSIGG